MRDIQATIDQAKALGSHRRLTAPEIYELHDRARSSADKGGKFDLFNVITEAYDFGFTLGYRLGAKGNAGRP